MKSLVISGAVLLALLFGAIAAVLGGVPALIVATLVAPLLLLLTDYRVGVIALTIVLPWASSPLLPQEKGLNVVNYLVLLSLVTLVVPKLVRRQPILGLPRPVIWLYLVPVCIGMALAWPHISEGAYNFAGTKLELIFTPYEFVKTRFLKPLAWVLYALLLANAVRDSRHPERWFMALAASALLPVMVVFAGVSRYGTDLQTMQASRGFLSLYGLHANEFGLLLLTACIPLLWLTAATRGKARIGYGAALVLTTVALVLTFSRGAWLGLFAALAIFIYKHRPVRTVLILIPFAVVALAFAPQVIIDRLTTGFGEGTESLLHSRDDQLTAGRVASWQLLAPEVLRSPVIGRGIGSTAWSAAVGNRQYPFVHPHNMFLAIVMDLGVVGLACLGALYVMYLRAFRRLAADDKQSPLARAFFEGAHASLVGLLVMGITNGDFMPGAQQTFYWFSLGLLYAYWQRARDLATEATPSLRTVGQRAMAARRAGQPAGSRLATRRPHGSAWIPPRHLR